MDENARKINFFDTLDPLALSTGDWDMVVSSNRTTTWTFRQEFLHLIVTPSTPIRVSFTYSKTPYFVLHWLVKMFFDLCQLFIKQITYLLHILESRFRKTSPRILLN
jgi:hypothetical protein